MTNIRSMLVLLGGALIHAVACGGAPAAPAPTIVRITPSVRVAAGAVNGVLIERNGKSIAIYGDPSANPPAVEAVLFTHYRRDVAWAGQAQILGGAKAIIPAAEADMFLKTDAYWETYWTTRFNDYKQQSSRVLRHSLDEATGVRGGEAWKWEGLSFEVMDTPGYTRGAVSYLFQLDGKRIGCVGDLIYGDGKFLDLFSLQDAIPATKEDGYHGYAARAADVIASLRRIAAWNPDLLIPARGPVITDPRAAIEKLIARLQAVFASHFANDALRWYRGDEKIALQAARVLGERRVAWMPMAETMQPLPKWVAAYGNSRVIISDRGAAFLIDCGGPRQLDAVKTMQREGRFKKLEGLYITHYHNDHTAHAQNTADEFSCPVYACAEMRDILENPGAYRMPALTPNAIRKIKATADGETRRWHEYEMTFTYFPGQTIYHGGLRVKRDGGETIFFIGDSFSPTGIDDYCLLNRNFFEPEKGFGHCLEVLRRMEPGYLLVNQHIAPAFRFSPAQLDSMIENWTKRKQLMAELFPFDDVNFGVDEQWARFYPYGSEVRAGQEIELQVVILNHSPSTQTFRVTPHLPNGWTTSGEQRVLPLASRKEGAVSFRVRPPPDWRGPATITADVSFGPWDFREWAEAVVMVK
ncbi:MAG: MBL fold metallo-hydrolase [Opitutaceae bacterium]|nr:MBL fold metallo-hydrolase [Opitutaceae bacterium]